MITSELQPLNPFQLTNGIQARADQVNNLLAREDLKYSSQEDSWHYIPSRIGPDALSAIAFARQHLIEKANKNKYWFYHNYLIDLGCGIGDFGRVMSALFNLCFIGVERDERLILSDGQIIKGDLVKDDLKSLLIGSPKMKFEGSKKIYYFYTPLKRREPSILFFQNLKKLQDKYTLFVFKGCGEMRDHFQELYENNKISIKAKYEDIVVFTFKRA